MIHPRLFILLLCGSLMGCKPASSPEVATEPPAIVLPSAVHELTPAKAAEWIASHPDDLILDLRMEEEVTREGNIPRSNHRDYLQPATEEYIATLDRTKPVLLYCALGGRSRHMAVKLHTLGFKDISLIQGGFNAWAVENPSHAK